MRIEKVTLQGFRAYLQPHTLELSSGKTILSMAILGANAKGKSSLTDAFEYYFSKEGTLKRLGKKALQTHAGPLPMEHVDAQEEDIEPKVHFWFREGKDRFDAPRPLDSPLPKEAGCILSHTKVPFIIRGHELRSFVEGRTPSEQYKELTRWFGLDPLLKVQQYLRALRMKVKERSDSTFEVDERSRELSRLTASKVSKWDDGAVRSWFNAEIMGQLDSSLAFAEFSKQDPAYNTLVARRDAEQGQLGLTLLRNLLRALQALVKPTSAADGKRGGELITLEYEATKLRDAVIEEEQERSRASDVVFNQIWSSAKELLEGDIDLDTCPVCDTEFHLGPHGSHDGVRINIGNKLAGLATYRKAEEKLLTARKRVRQSMGNLKTSLSNASSQLKDAGYDCQELLEFQNALLSWQEDEEVPESSETVGALLGMQTTIADRITGIEEQQGDNTYSNALELAKKLLVIKADLNRIRRTKAELGSLSNELDRQALEINKVIVGHIEGLVARLQGDVSDIYQDIQGSGLEAPPLRIELASQEHKDQQRAKLVIDFSENRQGVLPSGYLSDSQVHTLALALRLATIKMFNPQVPILVLDDVVTSYDADHRKTVVGTLVKYFSDFQIFLTTHDEQFFNLLKDQLPQGSWRFKRITEVREGIGPLFHDHQTSDEQIETKLNVGQSAGTEIRQAEEEWLLNVCRDFGTEVTIRSIERAFQYERRELADSLARFLKSAGIGSPQIPGTSKPFLTSLQGGVVENLASHFSDNPYKSPSVGDDKARWEEFKYYRDLFKCSSCHSRRFRRPPTLKKPVCSYCQMPFAFSQSGSECVEQ